MRPTVRSSVQALGRLVEGVRWYVRELTDESAYERWVAHVRAEHPDAPVMSRREFERMRIERREKDPEQGARCC